MPEETTRSGGGPAADDAASTDSAVAGTTSPADLAADTDDSARRTRAASTTTMTGSAGGAGSDATTTGSGAGADDSVARATGRFLKELVIIVVIALVASALLRAFVVQAFFVPSGSMLPTIQLNDRILVSRIGDVKRGEVVVFEDPGGWIPAAEQAPPPSKVRKAFEFVGVLPASGHEHLVKRVIGLPGDNVVCCDQGKLVINGTPVDESGFLKEGSRPADNKRFDVVVPDDHIFVLGDNRYVSGDSSVHLPSCDGCKSDAGFVPMSLVTGRAFAVIWPFDHRKILHIPDAYDDVPAGQKPPDKGVINPISSREGR